VINGANTVISGVLSAATLDVIGGRFVIAAGGLVISANSFFNADMFIAGRLQSPNTGNAGNMTFVQSSPESTAVEGNVTNSGRLTGQGTVEGSVDNSGTVGSETEATTITTSHFNSRPNSNVKATITPETGSNTFIETITISFAGNLELYVSSQPADGSSFTIMEYQAAQGNFDQVTIVGADSAECAPQPNVNRGPTQLTVVFAVPVTCSSQNVNTPTDIGGLSPGALAGIIIAGVAVLIGITAAIIFGSKTIKRKVMPWRYRG
jgi:adhesin HecA-like repeat protein